MHKREGATVFTLAPGFAATRRHVSEDGGHELCVSVCVKKNHQTMPLFPLGTAATLWTEHQAELMMFVTEAAH